jgi:hypothetical protein
MFEAVYHTMPREMQALMNAGLKGECVHGSADYEKLHNQYLINYYLAFFYTDMDNATSDQDKEDIKAFYKWDHTLPCLRRNGIVPGMGSVIAPPTEDTPTSDYRFSIFNDVFNDIFQ